MISDANSQQQEALRLAGEAERLSASGAREEALALLWQAVLRCAEAERLTVEAGEVSPLAWQSDRANTCRRCGDRLAEAGAHARAANIYQEAADLYGAMAGREAELAARHCAQQALASITALRTRPEERLYLLIAHHERLQEQLALQPGTEARQAECCAHMAAVFLRRDRPQEAVARYQEALKLYARVPGTTEVLLAVAECHHRIGGLLANALQDPGGAARHYRAAILLYEAHEPQVHGEQQSRALCARALAEVERRLPHEGLPL